MTYDEALREYLALVRAQRSHVGKVVQFIRFLENTFQVGGVDYEVEQRVDDARLQLRGWIDTVIGDTLFEFKTNLRRELADAENQLRSYLAVFHQRSGERGCVGIATDGVQFHVYAPQFQDGGLPELKPIELCDLGRLSGEDAVLWLDRYLFRRTPRVPDERDVAARFGAGSPTYRLTLSTLSTWWDQLKSEPPVALKYEVWQKQLTVVYGEGIGSEELFLQHTYLATLAKLLASVIFGRGSLDNELEILTGAYFRGLGVENFIEEDLFSWMLRPETQAPAVRVLRDLRSQLGQYDPSGFTEDVLKGLYQELVDPQVRHDLGEFYTPDWLAEYMLRKVLGDEPVRRMLDPACGSGTFLFLGIRVVTEALRQRRWSGQQILEHIEANIFGLDVHPLAVLVSRTNYLIACAPLLARRRGRFTVPVYLGDSLMYRSVVGTMEMRDVNVPADGETLWFPVSLRDNPELFDGVVSTVVYAAERRDKPILETYLEGAALDDAGRRMVAGTYDAVVRLFEAERDSIWGFVIRNLIRPYILSKGQPFDLVIGNPPWLSLRYIKSAEFQKFVKDQMDALKIKPKGAKLVTQIELASLFFAECARNYLRDGGTIAFVMPRSVLIHRQHEEFMRFRFGPFGVRCDRVLDLGDVSPLFSVPACAVIGTKSGLTVPPIPRTIFRGRLRRKNASWEEARKVLKTSEATWSPATKAAAGARYYLDKFRQGATIVPRRLWFVRVVSDPTLGFDPAAPLVESDPTLPTKKPWNEVEMAGQVEAEALYASVLSTDILPFHCLRVRPVVLPLVVDGETPVMLSSGDALRRGLRHLGSWLERAEAQWAAHKTEKAPDALAEWVDHLGKLRAQFPQDDQYLVVYCAAARETAGAVLELDNALQVEVDGSLLSLAGLALEHQVYWYSTSDRSEAFYLLGWVNCQAVDDAVRPRAMWGRYRERHIEKRIVEVGPPHFSPSDPAHAEMAALAEQAAAQVSQLVTSLRPRSLGSARRAIRTHPAVAPLLARIDELARQIGGL